MAGSLRRAVKGSRSGERRRGRAPELARFRGGGGGVVVTERKYLAWDKVKFFFSIDNVKVGTGRLAIHARWKVGS